MRKIIAFSFLCLFMMASFNQLAIMGMYVMSQDFITEKFCINQDKPEMQCQGKCHLKDVILQVEEQQSQDEHISVSSFFFPVFQENVALDIPSPSDIMSEGIQYTETLYSAYNGSIFHPPQVV